MSAIVILALLLANPSRVDTLVDQQIAIGPGKMRHLEMHLPDTHARLKCRFKVFGENGGVSVAIVEPSVWEAMRLQRAVKPLAATPVQRSGELSYSPAEPGRYVLVLDNPGSGGSPSLVHLNVEVVWPNGTHADPVRAQIVVWLSVVLFLSVLGWAAYRIKQAVEARDRNEAHFYYF